MKKKKPSDRLKSYSTLAGVVLASTSINAQVQYTDINPDEVLSTVGDSYSLDLNNDGTVDFILSIQHSTGSSFTLSALPGVPLFATVDSMGMVLGPGGVGFKGTNYYNVNDTLKPIPSPLPLSTSAAISSVNMSGSANFFAKLNVFMAAFPTTPQFGSIFGEWKDKEGYIGLKFSANSQDHFGWARVEVDSAAFTLTIKDYAFNATAGLSLNAGQTSGGGPVVGIESENDFDEQLTSYAIQNKLHLIMKDNDQLNQMYNIYNMVGQRLISGQINDVHTKVDLASYKGQHLIVEIQTNSGVIRKKISNM